VNVEVVRLQAIDNRGHLSSFAAFELQERDGRSVILVGLKDGVLGPAAVGGHLFDFGIHEEEQAVQGMATCG
jgi:hypothetical protein